MIQKFNLKDLLKAIDGYWDPHIVGELNGQHVKLAKIKGEFVWHSHLDEDEMFLVIDGKFEMHLPDQILHLSEGDYVIIPKGTEHKPVAKEEAHILLFEPISTVNTGDRTDSDLTVSNLKSL